MSVVDLMGNISQWKKKWRFY